ncbi:MAG TPA: DUF427 domain-containing protein [Acidimicrobiales bacterium]|nr:DUF427 domain-containing protein [Acidimicrobiales bacterium]
MKVEHCPKRVRAYVGGELVVDTINAIYVWEVPYYPAYYLPAADVRATLAPTGAYEHSPSRGDAEVLDVQTDGTVVKNAAKRYPSPLVEELRDRVRLEWESMDEWLEEDEPVYVHPRDPHTRVDILDSSRHVVVRVDGDAVAESHHPRLLFETGLPTRYYLPMTDVRLDLLTPTSTVTRCPYKGSAAYWSLGEHVDIAWCYRAPLPESQKIAGLIAFYNERVELVVDGVVQEEPRSRFRRAE